MERRIEETDIKKFKDYKEWLWNSGRTFSYDIIYMNIFSPGTASFSIQKKNIISGQLGYVLEASVSESDFIKKIYNAQMKISSHVTADNKGSACIVVVDSAFGNAGAT